MAPKTHLLNKILFQIHLWAGIALGLYILMISVSGVAYLLESELDRLFVPSTIEPDNEAPLEGDALDARVEEVYRDFEVVMISPPFNPERAAAVVIRQGDVTSLHYFDPYREIDLGSARPWQTSVYRWLIDFHNDLLIPRGGRRINGWFAASFIVMTLSGLVIWWRGKAQWHQGLYMTPKSPRGMLWQFHSVFGFWCLFFMFAWGISGMLLGIPDVVRNVTDTFGLSNALGMGMVGMTDPEIQELLDAGLVDNNPFNPFIMNLGDIRADRGSGFMDFMVDVHFGRFEAAWTTWALAIIGLVPVALFISGFILWWQRVVIRTYRKIMRHS